MNQDEMLSKMQAIVAQSAHVPIERVSNETRFLEDLNMDSLHVMNIAITVEEEFGVRVPTDAFLEVNSVKQLFEFVQRLQV